MSKKPVPAAEPQATPNIAGAGEQAEAERLAAEQAEALSTGVLLRREAIDGMWYPHGAVLTCAEPLARSLESDGALDLHPSAVEYALANGAPQLVHTAPEPGAE